MSALDLDAEVRGWRTKLVRCAARLLDASYGEYVPHDVANAWRETAADAADAEKALITRLRAAEARTAWQPIETAPLWPDRSPTPLWIVGQRVARPPVTVAQTAPGVYVDEYSNRQHVTAWAPLPAAPEAP